MVEGSGVKAMPGSIPEPNSGSLSEPEQGKGRRGRGPKRKILGALIYVQ